MTSTRISAVILAGGRSSRFGRDKLVEPIDGSPLLHHAIEAVRPMAAEIIVVAAPDATPAVPADVRIVHDPVAFEGPLAATRVGLEAAKEAIVVLVGGDMPSLVAEVLESMVSALGGFDVVVLEHDGRPRPLPMAIRREPGLVAADRLLDQGERRLRALTDTLETKVFPEVEWRLLDHAGATIRDIDTPADLA